LARPPRFAKEGPVKTLRIAGAVLIVFAIVFVCEVLKSTAHAQASQSVPKFELDPYWPKPLPNKWITGQIPGIAVDSHDHIWVIHRPKTIRDQEKGASLHPPTSECCFPAPPVLEFDIDGNLIQAWGGPGQGYEWPENEHGIFVDSKDNVWIGGNGDGDAQILKFTTKGKFLLQIGHKGHSKGSNDTENLGKPAAMFVYPKTNELFVADGYANRRVIVFDADTGAYKRHWGAYGKRPEDLKNPPREQIITGPPPTFFNPPVHGVVVSNDGLVYVADRANNRLQVFKLDGTFVKEAFVKRDTLDGEGTVYGFAFSPDKDQKFLYSVDGPNMWLRILNRQTLQIVDSVGGHGGHQTGAFYHLHSIAASTDSKGNIYLGEVNEGQRYMRYLYKGMGAPSHPETAAASSGISSTIPSP
jgi:NHL repeat-containing protein